MMRYPYVRGEMPIDQYLRNLLLALVAKAGGELRIKASDILRISPTHSLVKTIDDKKGEVVLRFGSTDTEVYQVGGSSTPNVPCSTPIKAPSVQPLPNPPQPLQNLRRATPEEQAELEHRFQQEQVLTRMAPPQGDEPSPRHVMLNNVELWLKEQERAATGKGTPASYSAK